MILMYACVYLRKHNVMLVIINVRQIEVQRHMYYNTASYDTAGVLYIKSLVFNCAWESAVKIDAIHA